jgi:hypothetical protein
MLGTLLVPLRSSANTTTIDTTSSWTGQGVGPFGGAGGSYAFGQTFVAPSDSDLQSITVFLRDDYAADVPVEFRMYVASWEEVPAPNNNGQFSIAHPVGPILFTSDVLASDGKPGVHQWEQLTVNVGDLSLAAGQKYVFFFGTYGLQYPSNNMLSFGFFPVNSPYPDGQFFYTGGGKETIDYAFGADGHDTWNYPLGYLPNLEPGGDLAFTAIFVNPAPERMPGMFLAAPVILLLLAGRSKARRQAQRIGHGD